MPLSIYQVDAFTDRPFQGNPAAVCFLAAPCESAWMQALAQEMNLSETAFLLPDAEGWSLRWFTPTVEVDLCGHATLASAHVLWETGRLAREEPARFQTRSGLLTAELRGDLIVMDFPAEPVQPADAPPGLEEALGIQARWVGRNRMDYLVEAESPERLRAMQPDFTALSRVEARGVIVTARSDRPEYDFVSRCFYPASGINEDPVTGSAHCALGPYWQARIGKEDMAAFQASARGGVVHVAVRGERVHLGGQAVTVLRGELAVE